MSIRVAGGSMTELIWYGAMSSLNEPGGDMRVMRPSTRTAWLGPAAALLGAGWGSNQFTPMLLVYGEHAGVGTSTRTALFGAYAIGLVPGLLLGGPLADARGRRPVVLAAAC